jgi:hypothetical protein
MWPSSTTASPAALASVSTLSNHLNCFSPAIEAADDAFFRSGLTVDQYKVLRPTTFSGEMRALW